MSKIISKTPVIVLASGTVVIGWSPGMLIGDKEWIKDAEFASSRQLPQKLYLNGPVIKADLKAGSLEAFSAMYYFAGNRTRIIEAPKEILDALDIEFFDQTYTDQNDTYLYLPSSYHLEGRTYFIP